MKKQTFYVLGITLTLIGASLCTSCHRLMGDDDDMIEVDEISLIETRNKQLDILNNAFDIEGEDLSTTSLKNEKDTICLDDRDTGRLLNDSIRYIKN